MVFCCICGVHFRHKSDGIRFHRLPKNSMKRKQWLAVIEEKIKNFSYTENSVICSQHFTNDCYIITGCSKFYLKPGTIPTIFDMPLRNGNKSTQVNQRMQQQNTCDGNINTTEASWIKVINEQDTELREQSLLGTSIRTTEDMINIEDIHVSNPKVQQITKFGLTHSTNVDISNPYEELLYKIRTQEEKIKSLTAKLKTYQQKNRRLQKKVSYSTMLLKYLKEQKLLYLKTLLKCSK